MMRTLFLVFVFFVLLSYAAATWLGWEIFSSSSRSRLGFPFITSYRGGK
ncbi:MAG: hypothetical protein N2Z23_04365 [Pyrinomonadaceae bacterium]|nr:hypothetical protein [Pyrinomonadaceae bacterium]